MRRSLTATLSAPLWLGLQLFAAPEAVAQPTASTAKVPLVTLADADTKSAETFGAILGLRHLPDGRVLVNDGARRRLVLLDKGLGHGTVVIDSTAGTTNSYGPRPSPLIHYLGDSSLFVDAASTSLLVIDPQGKVQRVMSAPKPQDLRFLGAGQAYVDDRGRLVYRGAQMVTQNRTMLPGERPRPIQPPDSAPILRADFDTRQVDTIARVKLTGGMRMTMDQGPDGKMQMKMTVNPLQTVDDWAVLADGSLAFIRGQDYHVEVVNPQGEMARGPKLPFDWKRLTDEDKQRLVDSARTALETQQKAQSANATPGSFSIGGGGASGGGAAGGGEQRVMIVMSGGGGGGAGNATVGGGDGGGMPAGQPINIAAPKFESVPLNEIADYYPAIRPGAARPDLDGNLWILTTTTAQSQSGELVYDVVNRKGELFQRVRLPKGRSVAGFGRDGIVYLMTGDRTNGFVLERTSLKGVASN